MPAPHHSGFYRLMPFCRPTNSIKALKAILYTCKITFKLENCPRFRIEIRLTALRLGVKDWG